MVSDWPGLVAATTYRPAACLQVLKHRWVNEAAGWRPWIQERWTFLYQPLDLRRPRMQPGRLKGDAAVALCTCSYRKCGSAAAPSQQAEEREHAAGCCSESGSKRAWPRLAASECGGCSSTRAAGLHVQAGRCVLRCSQPWEAG